MTQRSFRELWNAESSQPVRRISFVFVGIAAMFVVFQLMAIAMHFLQYLPPFRYDPVNGKSQIPDSYLQCIMGLIGGFAFVLVGTIVAPNGSRVTALGLLGGLFVFICCAGLPALIPPSHGIEFLFLGLVIGGMLGFIAVTITEYRTSRTHRSDPSD